MSEPGIGVDSKGGAVIDPTKNVLDLVQASDRRQDDLRNAEALHIREIIRMQSDFHEKLAEKESARIDAIRSVDVAAVQRAAEVAAEAVQTLAAQVPITAEAVRTSLSAALNPILNDIAELRKVQYEQQGQRAAVTEQHTTTDTARNLLVGILGLLLMAAFLIGPHIH